MIVACSVAAAVRTILKRSTSSRPTRTESIIEEKFKSLFTKDNPRRITDKMKELIAELGIAYSLFAVVKAYDGITCYFICASEKLLKQLHEHYASGHMQRILEKIFTLLVHESRHTEIFIHRHYWDPEFAQVLSNLSRLKARGQ